MTIKGTDCLDKHKQTTPYTFSKNLEFKLILLPLMWSLNFLSSSHYLALETFLLPCTYSKEIKIDGKKVETASDFIFLGSKVNANGDCRHKIKRCLHLGRKVIRKLDSILKIRDITLPTKVHIVKAMFFPSSYLWMKELDH